jgi:hypothetical protein
MGKKTFGADLYAKGENPSGQTSQTADETVRNQNGCPPQQWNGNLQGDGSRWNRPVGGDIKPRTYPKHNK